jgi:hypothetical protein
MIYRDYEQLKIEVKNAVGYEAHVSCFWLRGQPFPILDDLTFLVDYNFNLIKEWPKYLME